MPGFNLNRSHRRPPSSYAAKTQHHGSPPKRGHVTSAHILDQQLFDFLIVVDFECTCERDRRTYPNEIIEFPAILVDIRRGIVDKKRSFHTYVKPWRNPKLTAFCTELTGITQDKVDSAPSMQEAVQMFVKWYQETIPVGSRAVFATDGPWDFKNFLFTQAVLRDHVSFPTIFYEYFDVRTTFSRVFNKGDPLKLDAMLKKMKLRFEGSPHCGFDDAFNIARLALEMMKRGCVFEFLIALPLDDEEFHYKLDGYPVFRREEGSGFVTRDHVEQAAKEAFGAAYFAFAKSNASSVEMYRKQEHEAALERAGSAANEGGKIVRTRRDGGLATWRARRLIIVALTAGLLIGIVVALILGKLSM